MRISMSWIMTAGLAARLAGSDIGPDALQSPTPQSTLERAVVALACDPHAHELCRARGLDLLSLTWEDTGRSSNSCWGPNISDLTIQVLGNDQTARALSCMPVIRRPNFTDVSCDVPIGRLKLLVGNEHGEALHAIDLASYLRDFAQYQHAPTGAVTGSLLHERDREVLVSAQACVLPVRPGTSTSFAPVLFNYQACVHDPAVLVIMATPEGTSAQVMSANAAASMGVVHGQRLFHNRNGERAVLLASRSSDHPDQDPTTTGAERAKQGDGLSMVLIIQVPLLQRTPQREENAFGGPQAAPCAGACPCECASDMVSAVVSSGSVEGPWIGLDQCTIQRDPRFPIRATVQFYQATDTGGLVSSDVQRLGAAIDRIYLDADAVGSLVVASTPDRLTAPAPAVSWPQPWWGSVCQDYTRRTGEAWSLAMARLHQRLGADWEPQSAQELRNALTLSQP